MCIASLLSISKSPGAECTDDSSTAVSGEGGGDLFGKDLGGESEAELTDDSGESLLAKGSCLAASLISPFGGGVVVSVVENARAGALPPPTAG